MCGHQEGEKCKMCVRVGDHATLKAILMFDFEHIGSYSYRPQRYLQEDHRGKDNKTKQMRLHKIKKLLHRKI